MSDTTCDCGKPTSGAFLCDRCEQTLAYAVANISAYWADLETVQTKRTRFGDGAVTKGSIGKTQPLPIDGRFADVTGTGTQAKWDAWNTIVAWCRVVMTEQPELRGATCGDACLHTSCAAIRRRRWPTANTVPAMCAYLHRQMRWIVREQFAATILDELTYTENRLRRLVDRPADRWYAGKCSMADESGNICTAELYATTDRGTVRCPGCGYEHDVADRRDFLLTEAREYLVTASEAARALISWTDYDGSETKLVDRIRKWRDRDRLEVRDVTSLNGRDRHLYRLGDIQQLLVGDAQAEQNRHISATA